MEFYTKTGYDHGEEIRDTGTLNNSDSAGLRHLGSIRKLPAAERGPFPDSDTWLCETIDIAAERDHYRHIGSVKGNRHIHIRGQRNVAEMLVIGGAAQAPNLT